MIKQHALSFCLAILMSFGLSACGENDDANAHPEFTHDRNTEQNDFDANAIAWEFDNQEGLKIHRTAESLYLQFTHHSTLPNVQFFLDIDNNPCTGVPVELGADYMVENGWLYVATDSNAWGWKEIAPVPSVVEEGVRDTIMIALSKLQNISTIFKADAQSLGDTWSPEIFSPSNEDMKSTYGY